MVPSSSWNTHALVIFSSLSQLVHTHYSIYFGHRHAAAFWFIEELNWSLKSWLFSCVSAVCTSSRAFLTIYPILCHFLHLKAIALESNWLSGSGSIITWISSPFYMSLLALASTSWALVLCVVSMNLKCESRLEVSFLSSSHADSLYRYELLVRLGQLQSICC